MTDSEICVCIYKCVYIQVCIFSLLDTFRISDIISLGSRLLVVFMLHVKRRLRGLTCSSLVVAPL